MAEGGDINIKLTGGHTDSALCVDCTSDGGRIVSGGEDGEVCLWDRNGTLLHKIHPLPNDCTSVWVSKTKDNMFYIAAWNSVKYYDERNLQQCVESFEFNEEEINQIVCDEKEHYLAACDDSGEVKVISLEEKRLYKTLRRKHTNICSTVCFRYRKPWEIFSGGMDCNLIHWDFSRPKCINQFNMQELQDAPSDLGAYMVNPPFVHHLSMSPDGKYLACALENGFISVFDTSKKNISETLTLHGHSQGVSQVSFISNSKLISSGNDSVIVEWDLELINVPNEMEATNGHTSVIHSRNAQISHNCRVQEIHHEEKINWIKCFRNGNNTFMVVADQSADLTIMPL